MSKVVSFAAWQLPGPCPPHSARRTAETPGRQKRRRRGIACSAVIVCERGCAAEMAEQLVLEAHPGKYLSVLLFKDVTNAKCALCAFAVSSMRWQMIQPLGRSQLLHPMARVARTHAIRQYTHVQATLSRL